MPHIPPITSSDPCRFCGGRKGHKYREERDGRMIDVWECCWMCEGTGKQTVRVIDDEIPSGVWAG